MAGNSYLLNQMARPDMSSTSPFSQVGAPLEEIIISLAGSFTDLPPEFK
jgi:hypothetical protein